MKAGNARKKLHTPHRGQAKKTKNKKTKNNNNRKIDLLSFVKISHTPNLL